MSSAEEDLRSRGKKQPDGGPNTVESLDRYKHVYRYITKGVYSKHLPEQKKRVIRRSANNFSVEGNGGSSIYFKLFKGSLIANDDLNMIYSLQRYLLHKTSTCHVVPRLAAMTDRGPGLFKCDNDS